MMIERKDVVVRLGVQDAARRGLTVQEASCRLIAKGYRSVAVFDDNSLGIQSPKMSSLAAAIFIGDIIQTIEGIA